MPITRRPTSSNGVAIAKADVNALISRGGSPSRGNGKTLNHIVEVPVVLRIPEDELARVDDLISRRRVRTSRNRWMLEAIAEKILRESKKLSD